MRLFEESRSHGWQQLPAEQVACYREVLNTHANDPANGRCPICDLAGCRDWRSAYDGLAAAGELMAETARWRTLVTFTAHH